MLHNFHFVVKRSQTTANKFSNFVKCVELFNAIYNIKTNENTTFVVRKFCYLHCNCVITVRLQWSITVIHYSQLTLQL